MGRKKKEALIQFNQDNILSAAKVLFETKGIAATTMDEIAKEADCSKSTMYVYFKNKEQIIQYIILENMTFLRNLLNQCLEQEDDIKNNFYAILNALTKYEEEHPVFYQLLLGEILVSVEDVKEHNVLGAIYEEGEKINDVIGQLLQKGIETGQIRSDLPMIETVLYLWSSMSEMIRFAKSKEEYLKMRLGITKQDYLEYACNLLLKSIEP